MSGVEAQGSVSLLAEVTLVGFAQCEARHAAARVHHVEIHAVLVAVEGHHGQTLGVGGADDARHVAVGIEGNRQLTRGAAQEIVAVYAHFRIVGAGNGVFVVVGAGIFGIFLEGGFHALEHLHAIDGDFRLIVAHPAEHLAVGGEVEGARRAKLLFVHPVGDAVEHLVALAVSGHLRFGVAVEEFHDEEVVVARKGHDIAVGREEGRHLGTAFRERFVLAVGHIIDIIDRQRGAAIDGSGFRAEENLLLVGAHDVAIDALEFGCAAGFVEIEKHTGFLSRLEGRTGDASAVGRKLRITFAVVEGMHPIDVLGGERAVVNLFDGDLRRVVGRGRCCKECAESGQETERERRNRFHKGRNERGKGAHRSARRLQRDRFQR